MRLNRKYLKHILTHHFNVRMEDGNVYPQVNSRLGLWNEEKEN